MINELGMTDYIQSEVTLAETQLFKISGWLLHWVHYGFNVYITASFALNKCQCAIPSTNCPCSVMRDPSIMIMVSYKRRENELSSDVYIFEKIILIIE